MTSRLKFRVLTLLLTARVSCLGPWTKQNFPASLKTEKTLSHRSTKAENHSRLLNNWRLRYFQFNLLLLDALLYLKNQGQIQSYIGL